MNLKLNKEGISDLIPPITPNGQMENLLPLQHANTVTSSHSARFHAKHYKFRHSHT